MFFLIIKDTGISTTCTDLIIFIKALTTFTLLCKLTPCDEVSRYKLNFLERSVRCLLNVTLFFIWVLGDSLFFSLLCRETTSVLLFDSWIYIFPYFSLFSASVLRSYSHEMFIRGLLIWYYFIALVKIFFTVYLPIQTLFVAVIVQQNMFLSSRISFSFQTTTTGLPRQLFYLRWTRVT